MPSYNNCRGQIKRQAFNAYFFQSCTYWTRNFKRIRNNIIICHYHGRATALWTCDAGGLGSGYLKWQAAALQWQANNIHQPIFFKITTIDGLTTETANHALRCTALSGFVMAPSIPVILDILRRGTHSLSAECQCLRTPEGSVWASQPRARWAGPVDSSLALLSQQEDISWSNREAVDEGCLVSRENGVGED